MALVRAVRTRHLVMLSEDPFSVWSTGWSHSSLTIARTFLGSTCSAFVPQTTLGYAVHSKAVPYCCFRCFAFQLL